MVSLRALTTDGVSPFRLPVQEESPASHFVGVRPRRIAARGPPIRSHAWLCRSRCGLPRLRLPLVPHHLPGGVHDGRLCCRAGGRAHVELLRRSDLSLPRSSQAGPLSSSWRDTVCCIDLIALGVCVTTFLDFMSRLSVLFALMD